MLRAILFFVLVLGIVLGGLLLLRKTAGRPLPKLPAQPRLPPSQDKKDKDEDGNGWS